MTLRSFSEIPVLGPLREQLRLARNDRLNAFAALAARGEDIVRFSAGFGRVAVVNHPDLAHAVLVRNAKHFEKSTVLRGALHPLGGDGLFTSEGPLWRSQRKLMAPLFTPDAVAGYTEAMVRAAERVVDAWDDGEIDMARETTRISMSIASKTLFDIDTFEEADALGEALTSVLEWVGETTGSAPMVIQARVSVLLARLADRVPRYRDRLRHAADRARIPVLLPNASTRKMTRGLAFLDERVSRMIAERRGDDAGRTDLLSRLIAARDADSGAKMSERQVRDEVLTLFVAGHETTANGLAWSLMFLAQHPEWYARAQREAIEGNGAYPILTRVFKEALRIYPPLYLLGRVANEDTVVGDYAFPKGAVTLISPFAMHRRTEIWPDPDRFDPDRFLPEHEAGRARTAYLPLGAGPRVCIGGSFAMLEGPIALAAVLSRMDLALVTPSGSTPEPVATIRPRGGLPMRVRRRAR